METRWVILLICLLLPALLAAGIVWIQIQNMRTSSWKQAVGRIVSSRSVSRDIRSKQFSHSGSGQHTSFITDEKIETRNFADIAYTFMADGNSYNGNRVGLGADSGNFEVPETLKRYPQGKTVTVYYNPADPNDCILERDDPQNIRNGWLAVLILVALIGAGFVAITQGADWLSGVIAVPKRTPLVVILAVFSLTVMLLARVAGRQVRTMKTWPATSGRITRSEIQTTVQTRSHADSSRLDRTTMYGPRIVYAYQVGGNTFEGDNIGTSGCSNTPSLAERYVRRYPLQMPVQVFYDPNDPTQSTLALPGQAIPLALWVIAALLGGAAYAAGWLIR